MAREATFLDAVEGCGPEQFAKVLPRVAGGERIVTLRPTRDDQSPTPA